ncbi:MAG: acyltransferase [Candidatus Hydrogenedentes bacterium]|nr:acyltransferase [Candidatus Hydrogenedentota bacterium]
MTKTADMNHGLHLLRGICAVGIAVYHFLAWNDSHVFRSLGTFGVYTFFILSALTMSMVYFGHFSEGISRSHLLSFYRNRFARIVPLLATVTLGFSAYQVLRGRADIGNLAQAILQGSGLFGLHLPGFLGLTAGAWTIGIEVMFYAVFPVVALLGFTTRLRNLGVTILVLIGAQQLLFLTLPEPEAREFWWQYTTNLMFAPFFAIGIYLFRTAKTDQRPIFLAGTFGLFFIMAAYSTVFDIEPFDGGWHYLALTGISALAVMSAYRSHVPAWLQPVSVYLGNISYSLYLTHWIAYRAVRSIDAPALKFTAFALCSLAIATALFYFLESPARRALRARQDKTTPASLSPATL